MPTLTSIPREVVERVRESVPIGSIAEGFTKLRRQGAEFVGLCPLHEEHTPSFSVNPTKGVFHCHGCGQGGDVFTFIMLAEGVPFPDAVRRVAEIGGVSIDGTTIPPAKRRRLLADADRRRSDRELDSDFDCFERCAFLLAALERDDRRERIAWLGTFLDWGFHNPEIEATDWYVSEREQAENELATLIDREQILGERLRIITEGTDDERADLYDVAS